MSESCSKCCHRDQCSGKKVCNSFVPKSEVAADTDARMRDERYRREYFDAWQSYAVDDCDF